MAYLTAHLHFVFRRDSEYQLAHLQVHPQAPHPAASPHPQSPPPLLSSNAATPLIFATPAAATDHARLVRRLTRELSRPAAPPEVS